MRKVVVVDHPKHFQLEVEDVEVVSVKQYLTDPEFARTANIRVFNLSREYVYLSKGYYVSLLAEARGHKVIPSVKTMQDLKSPLVRVISSDELDDLIEHSLRRIRSDEYELSIYFGENIAKQYLKLSQALYRQFQAPLLRARFVRQKRWVLQSVRPIGMSEIPDDHLDFLGEAARRYFGKKRYDTARTNTYAYDLAILVNPEEKMPPSDRVALDRFVEAAEEEGFYVELITRDDYARVAEFDALFLRETTSVNHHTYRFARRAQSEGLAVIDDPDSILRCANKVYLAELLSRARIPTPKTLIVHADNRRAVATEVGLPCVLKLPDASFSLGVKKVTTEGELRAELDRMLNASDLVIAQAYMPTDFDWRIGVLEGEPLYACKYFMARGHWQIYNWEARNGKESVGGWETLPIDAVPAPVLEVALKATRLIGDGLYGVDVKEIDGQPYLIEVNDNPSIDDGVEDALIGDDLYRRVIRAIKHRIERQREIHHVAAVESRGEG